MPTETTIPIPSRTYPIGTTQFWPVTVPTGATTFDLKFDVSTFTDPTWTLNLTFDLSFDGGTNWVNVVGLTMPGGAPDDNGNPIAVAGFFSNLSQPNNANRRARGSLTLTGHNLTSAGTLIVV